MINTNGVLGTHTGIKEMQRGHSMGLKGAMVWQVPDPRLPFTSEHYESLWAACAEAGAPVICHILTGHSYIKTGQKPGLQGLKDATNAKTNDSANTLFDFIFSGAFDRHPKLRLLLAESEIGWLPFMLQQWDYYFERFRRDRELPIKRKPSEIFNEHVYGTFLEDYVGTRFFPWWGEKNCMWSNDYPHFNMTFPHSRQVVEYHLSGSVRGETPAPHARQRNPAIRPRHLIAAARQRRPARSIAGRAPQGKVSR